MGESRVVAPLHERPSQYGLPSMGMLKRGAEVQEGGRERGVRSIGREGGREDRKGEEFTSPLCYLLSVFVHCV